MKTWQQFTESKEEEAEEKNGLDLDHDSEQGESEEHKNTVHKAKQKMLEFFEKRKSGAAKIASEASKKGGPAQLTAWHFAAKDKPYSEVLSAIKTNKDEAFFLQKCHSFVDKLKFKKLSQEEFQKIMGMLEVWGEAVSQLFGQNG